ncbi:MAG: nicotinamide-nucleotide adenylyltransferase [Thermofilaceae archaeon]|nr:nicotinamide-nucleotide adenylyltransferase [Thermofilaceae archaeon]MDW8003662.1 nicotinamide-nucleotide adenylyltransferase [Thermofilaceae archaeon]
MVERGLFIGRFQPFHQGHLYALKWIAEREREVVIAVGSAQHSYSFRNPFTLGERLEMISLCLKEKELWGRTIVAGVPDTNGQHSLWVQVVKTCCPHFSRVYTNEPLTRLLFEEAGYRVIGIPFFNRELYEGTRVRTLIAEGGDWESLVPQAVAVVIKEINGIDRIRQLYQLEKGKGK